MSAFDPAFGMMDDKSAVCAIKLEAYNMSAHIMSYGATLMDWRGAGMGHSLVLGLETFEDYVRHTAYMGANVGRCINRIGGARYELDGKTYQLDANENARNMLHGGRDGSANRNWQLVEFDKTSVTFKDSLPDGHMGFGGKLDIFLTYQLTHQGLALCFEAQTDAPTLCNLGHHSYFNLNGGPNIKDHTLSIDAPHRLDIDSDLIPTGELIEIQNTAFDLTHPQLLADVLGQTPLDHNFCLSDKQTALRDVATLSAPGGPTMMIATTEPGLQVYDGAGLGDVMTAMGARPYSANAGLALEPQGWPDAANQAHFPSVVLRPGETYHQRTEFNLKNLA